MNLKLGKRTSRKQISQQLAFVIGAIGVVIAVVVSVHLVGVGRGYWKTRKQVQIPAKVEFAKNDLVSPEMHYSYQWGGKVMTGERLSPFPAYPSIYLKGYAPGDSIKVWIDPDDPSYALFDRRWSWSTFLPLPFALVISGVVSIRYLGIAAFGSKPRKKRHFGKPLLRLP
jgi:hypothetical protein